MLTASGISETDMLMMRIYWHCAVDELVGEETSRDVEDGFGLGLKGEKSVGIASALLYK